MVERGLSFQARREVLAQVLPRYREASADQKCLLLDEFAQITGYHRKYAMWLLNHIEQGQRAPVRPRSCRYGSDEQQALVLAWNAANRICTKRLMPFLPTLIEALERHGHLHLTEACRSQRLSMSAATADRLLFCPQPVPNYDLNTSSVNTTDKKEFNVKGVIMVERCVVVLIFLCLSALLEDKTEKRDAHGKLPIREPLLPTRPVDWH